MDAQKVFYGSDPERQMLHAYLICSEGSRGEELARDMAKAAVCSGKTVRPCNACAGCRKAAKGIHPDIITVSKPLDAKGAEKNEIVVSQAREIIAQAYVLPNEAGAKVFIIEQADSMNVSAQNALLKILEEPPGYAYFFLVATNAEALLPTVRSRLALVPVRPEQAGQFEEMELTRDFFSALEKGGLAMAEFCVSIEKLPREAMREFLQNVRLSVSARLRRGAQDSRRLIDVARLCGRMEGYTASNVSSGHIAGTIAATLSY